MSPQYFPHVIVFHKGNIELLNMGMVDFDIRGWAFRVYEDEGAGLKIGFGPANRIPTIANSSLLHAPRRHWIRFGGKSMAKLRLNEPMHF